MEKIWERLKKVKRLHCSALSQQKWEGVGKVSVEEKEGRLLFHEEGQWTGHPIGFRNVFRWTLNPKEELISLEHLRFGPGRPVFLFDLSPAGPHLLESLHPYLCREDAYFGQLHVTQTSLRLHWRILGPWKDEDVDFHYH